MDQLSCNIIKDLLPSYVEDLVNEDSRKQIETHLSECKECYTTYLRMVQNVKITTAQKKPDQKTLFYLSSIRIWYFLCPFLAFVFLYLKLDQIWHLYEGFLLLIVIICISSQFFSGLTHFGFDQEQVRLSQEAEKKAQKKWGLFYASPLTLCLPALFILVITMTLRMIHYFT